jgi:hypothetical protein
VNFSYKVANEATPIPLQQIHVQNGPDFLVSCDPSHDHIFFESMENGHAVCKSLITSMYELTEGGFCPYTASERVMQVVVW